MNVMGYGEKYKKNSGMKGEAEPRPTSVLYHHNIGSCIVYVFGFVMEATKAYVNSVEEKKNWSNTKGCCTCVLGLASSP